MQLVQWVFLLNLLLCVACAPEMDSRSEITAVSESAIIDGKMIFTRTTPASKSVVYIELIGKDNLRISYCTGTLIAKNFVLTAAHCFDPNLIPDLKAYNVVFSNQVRDFGNRIVRPGIAYRGHSDYNSLQKKPLLYDHDIAVMMFAGDIPAGFAPVSIDTDVAAIYSNVELYAYGYGRLYDYTGDQSDFGRGGSGYLRRGVVRVDGKYSATSDRYFISDKSPAFLCQGDSGGPQFYNKGHVLKVVGVNSASLGEFLPNGKQYCRGVSQATKVAPFSSWILKEQKQMLSRYKSQVIL